MAELDSYTPDQQYQYAKFGMLFSMMMDNWWDIMEKAVEMALNDGIRQRSKVAFGKTAGVMFPALAQFEVGRELLDLLDPNDSTPLAIALLAGKDKFGLDPESVLVKFRPIRARFGSSAAALIAVATD